MEKLKKEVERLSSEKDDWKNHADQRERYSDQRYSNQHTDQHERYSDQHTDQRDHYSDQHTDRLERYSDQHTDQRDQQRYQHDSDQPIYQQREYIDQHNYQYDQHIYQYDQHIDQYDQHIDQRDQHTDRSKYTRPLEPIPSNASNEGNPPPSTGQPLPPKQVGNSQGDKKELSDTGPRSVDVETSIAGFKEPYTENPLVTDVDTEIKEMAAVVREEVKSRDFVATGLHEKPYDPNLICPMCGKRHRIGEIQKFRIHVRQCNEAV